MGLSANDLIFLLELARSKSISSAAKKMGLDQSTLSRQLFSLESKLGRSLFSRHRSGLEPSSYVKSLLETAEKVELLVRGLREFDSCDYIKPQGQVHISCPSSIADRMLAYHLPEFLRANPLISIRLSTSTENYDLSKLECDIAIRVGKPSKGDVVNLRLINSPLKFFGPKSMSRDFQEVKIENLPLLCLKAEVQMVKRIFPQIKQSQIRLVSNRLSSNLIAAENGAGAVLIPEIFGSYLKTLDLIDVKDWPSPLVTIFMSSPKVVRKIPHIEATWNWIKRVFTPQENSYKS